MTCNNCEAENPPGRSTCTMCHESLTDGTVPQDVKAALGLTDNQFLGLTKKLQREPGSSLYLTWNKSRKEKKCGAPPFDLKDIPFSEWANLLEEIPTDTFALSSDLEVDALKGDGSLFIRNTSKQKHAKGVSTPIGEAIISIVVYPTASQEDVCLDLHVSSANEVVSVARDFLHNPHEILTRYDWRPSPLMTKRQPNSSPPKTSGNTNSPSYIAPVTTTTYFVSEDFEF